MQKKEKPSYNDLFLSFFWMGLTAFGGPAMSAHIRKHIVDKKKWLDSNTFDSGLALCQVIPGAIVMQLAAYIGLKLKGIRGAVVCFIGFGLPAFLIMFILSVIYKHSKNIAGVELVLNGLRVIIVAIVANAAYVFGKKNFSNANNWVIAVIAAGLFLTKIHPALVLLVAAFLGLVLTKKELNQPEKSVKSNTFKLFLWLLLLVAVCTGILFFMNKKYFTLATIMLRIDLFTFGGGLAAMPIMYHELVNLFGWFSEKTFMDGVILGQVTPGSIIIAATFFGYMHFGILGSLLAISFEFIKGGFSVIYKYSRSTFNYDIPKIYCFDDLGTENNLKYYGNDCNVMAEILLSRYDLFVSRHMITHITTNLNSTEIEDIYLLTL
jgi:chromate transporter